MVAMFRIKNKIRLYERKVLLRVDYLRYRRFAERYNIRGYSRIYQIHLRKTGGTSLNLSFLNLVVTDPEEEIDELRQAMCNTIVCRGRVYVGWNRYAIEKGAFFYAFSHWPLHGLHLKPKTFTFTCFRDPLRRLVSHYNMLMGYRVNRVNHPCMATEGPWLGDSFDDFLDNIPLEHMQNQLYMFSPTFDVYEALDALGRVSQICYTDQMDASVAALAEKTGLPLKTHHTHRSSYQAEIPDTSLERAREMLAEEYAFMERVQEMYPL